MGTAMEAANVETPRMSKIWKLALALVVVLAALSPVFAVPAGACSCAAPSDIRDWVDESEAAFVGTLIEKRDAGESQLFGPQSIYVFEVEEWVKGDLGGVIEVYSASDGAACGFEFWDEDMRIGAIITNEGGQLQGGLCSQIDPDVLLAAMTDPTPSSTGIGHLIAANGWSSTRLTVLDDEGDHVTDLQPPGETPEWSGTQSLELCPDGDLMVQVTQTDLYVWDLASLEVIATHDISSLQGFPADVSCREADASSIWALAEGELTSQLVETVPEVSVITPLPGVTGRIGTNYVISQTQHEGDAIWVDLETGEETRLTDNPEGQLVGTTVTAHPTEPLAAVLQVDYSQSGPANSTLSVFESTAPTETFDLPGEAFDPRWIDGKRVAAYSHDPENWEQTVGIVIDTQTGKSNQIPGWSASNVIGRGSTLYGADAGSILTADISSGAVDTLVTLATQSAGPFLLLDTAPTVDSTTTTQPETQSTTPPLVAGEETAGPDGVSTQWIAGGAVAIFFGILVWLAFRRPRTND